MTTVGIGKMTPPLPHATTCAKFRGIHSDGCRSMLSTAMRGSNLLNVRQCLATCSTLSGVVLRLRGNRAAEALDKKLFVDVANLAGAPMRSEELSRTFDRRHCCINSLGCSSDRSSLQVAVASNPKQEDTRSKQRKIFMILRHCVTASSERFRFFLGTQVRGI